jgi:hypothetical protein
VPSDLGDCGGDYVRLVRFVRRGEKLVAGLMTCGEAQRHRKDAGASTTSSGPFCDGGPSLHGFSGLGRAAGLVGQGLRCSAGDGSDGRAKWQRSASCSPDVRPAWAWCGSEDWGCSSCWANHEAAAFGS